MPELTWKTVIRSTWWPNLIMVLMLGWIISVSQGWMKSQDTTNFDQVKANSDRLERIEQQLRTMEADRAARHGTEPKRER